MPIGIADCRLELPIASAFRNRQWQSAIAMGQVYDSAGDRARAREFYAAALADLDSQRRLAPDDYQVHAAKGLTFAGLGRADEAVRHGSKAVDLLPVSRDAAEGRSISMRLQRSTRGSASMARRSTCSTVCSPAPACTASTGSTAIRGSKACARIPGLRSSLDAGRGRRGPPSSSALLRYNPAA